MISVVVPVAVPWAPVESVQCSLMAISTALERCPVHVEVVVVDDSSDHTAEWELQQELYGSENSRGMLRWLFSRHKYIRTSPPRVGRFTASRARNIGAANSKGRLIVFVDQDVMIAPDALEGFWEAYQMYGENVVIVGLYDWMGRIDFQPADVSTRFDEIVSDGLDAASRHLTGEGEGPSIDFPDLPMGDDVGLLGLDHRRGDFKSKLADALVDDAALGAHTGNLGVPHSLFMKVGGFDEAIVRHGGEDADFGLTCRAAGAKWVLWSAIWGVHRWHWRDQAANAVDVQHNIDYIDRKHGIGPYAEAHKFAGMDARDWADEKHYHQEVGGVAMQAEGDPTVWVCRDKHRLGIATPEALKRLGFTMQHVLVIPPSALLEYEESGVAQ